MLTSVSEVEGIGSDRKLPICISYAGGLLFWMICVYLPPCQGGGQEEEWKQELDGLQADVNTLKARVSENDLPFVLVGAYGAGGMRRSNG